MAEVLIDGYNLGMVRGTGIATYARNLCRDVAHIGHNVGVLYGKSIAEKDDPLLREIAFFDPKEAAPSKLRKAAGAVSKAIRSPLIQRPLKLEQSGMIETASFADRLPRCSAMYNGEDLFNRANIGFALGRGFSRIEMPSPIDLAHWTYPIPAKVKGAKNIYTLHDLVPLKLPFTTLDNKRQYLKLVKQIARHADHIVTVSECSKNDIMELLGVGEDRITNTYQTAHIPPQALAYDETELARIIEKGVGVPFRGYYLFWGSIEPKKNIHRLIEGYLASGVDAPLVIVGAQAWKSEEELRLASNLGVAEQSKIIQLSYAPRDLLTHLIRGARAALFPSLYEGFGLPALEAMVLGTPVISSNTASLPEVIGDAGLCVNPYVSKEIADAIAQMDGDEAMRRELSGKGRLQAEQFSSARYQERLVQLYERLI